MNRKGISPVAEGNSAKGLVIRKLRPAEQLPNQGQTVSDVSGALEASAPTNRRWQQLYGGR